MGRNQTTVRGPGAARPETGMPRMTPSSVVVDESRVEIEHSRREGVSWRMLTSADRTPTAALTSGVAEIEPGGMLALHHHPPPEVYYILEGSGVITLGEETRDVGPRVAIFIPGGMTHGLRNTGRGVLRFFYVFPVDSYSEIEYTMVERGAGP